MLRANPTFQSKHISVKITGDGTNISRTMHLVVIGSSLLDFDENPLSLYVCHTIALLNTTKIMTIFVRL